MRTFFRTWVGMVSVVWGLAVPGGALWAQQAETDQKIAESTGRVFKSWLADNDLKDGALVVMRGGEVIGRTDHGNRKTDLPVTVASLTKAITGACVAQLIDAGKLQLGDKLADVLKQELAGLGKPQDPRFNSISIADLLRNRSGLAPAADHTQGGIGPYLGRYSRMKKNFAAQMDLVARFDLATDPGTTYHYANVNWLLLGAVIERVSGEAYEEHCYKSVLKPLNLPVSGLSEDWTMLSSYGGWHISVQDYAKFASQLAQSVIDRKGPVNDWLLKLSAEAGGTGKPFYALGTNMRFTPKGRTLYHSGSWAVKTPSLEVSFGTYFVSFDVGVTYAASYSKAMGGKPLGELDRQMWQAIRTSLE